MEWTEEHIDRDSSLPWLLYYAWRSETVVDAWSHDVSHLNLYLAMPDVSNENR